MPSSAEAIAPTGRGHHGGRLDDLAHFHQLGDEILRRHGSAAPAEYVGVQVIPEARIADAHAGLLAGLDQALGAEHLERFAQHRAAHGHLLGQHRLARQRVTRMQHPAHDRLADFLDHLHVQILAAARLRCHHPPPPYATTVHPSDVTTH
jgi:hypothetical protein